MTRAHRPPRAQDTRGERTLNIPTTWATHGNCAIPATTNHALANAVFHAFDEPTLGITPAVRQRRLTTVRTICATCPVLTTCRDFGMTQEWGFYGGLTPEERDARRRGDERTHEQLADAAREVERRQRVARERAARELATTGREAR